MTLVSGDLDFFNPTASEKRQLLFFSAISLIFTICLFTVFRKAVFSEGYMPHAFCYLEKPGLIWTNVVADTLIGVSYTIISLCLVYFVYVGRREIRFRWLFLAFGLFIIACGGTHFMETITIWTPVYVLATVVKVFAAIASICTAAALPFAIPRAFSLVREAKASEHNRREWEVAVEQRDLIAATLRDTNRSLEDRILLRTQEWQKANERLQFELRKSQHLQSSISRLSSIVESSGDAIVGTDMKGKIFSWNLSAERLYGYAASEMVGKPLHSIIPASGQEQFEEMMAQAALGKAVGPFENYRVSKSGNSIDVSVTLSPILDPSGRSLGVSSIARDITTAKRNQLLLRDSEEQYRLLFDRNPLPMWIFDRESSRMLAVNDAAVKHYGYSSQEFLALSTADLLAPNADSDFQTDGTRKHRKKDGAVIEVLVTERQLSVPTPGAVLVLAQDVTEKAQSERKLRQSEERFRSAFRSSPLGITISTRNEGRYLDANSAFLSTMEFEPEDLIGRTIEELNIWSNPAERNLMLAQLDLAKPARPIETRFRTKSGRSRLVEVSAETIRVDDEPCILAITQDVTEARQLQQQFLQAQKMEAVGRLAGGVAHDFNNLLGVIIGYCEIATGKAEGNAAVTRHLHEIRKAGDRAAVLVRQLLAFSRQRVRTSRVLNLNEIIHNTLEMLEYVVRPKVSIKLELSDSLDSVRVNLGEMEQVLMNLVINARDAMADGGRVIIETRNIVLDEAYIGQSGPAKPGAYVMMAVSDTGMGMDEQTLSHAFEPFFTTKVQGQGTGLGLSTVWGIIKESGAFISVYSAIGKGTTFKMHFPRVNASSEALIPGERGSASLSGSETILLAEDNIALRALAVSVLQERGYNVLAAESGKMALEFAKLYEGEIALVLTDVVMPEMTGPELVKSLKQKRPDMKVLYMSGYARNLIVEEGVLDPDSTVLSKPFSSVDLLTSLRAILSGKK